MSHHHHHHHHNTNTNFAATTVTSSRKQYIMIPPTTENTIVFPYSTYSGTFQTSHYNPLMTNNQLDTYELSRFVNEIEQILEIYRQPGYRQVKKLLFSLFGGFIALIIITIVIVTQVDPSEGAIIPAIIIPLFFGFFLLSVCMMVRFRKRTIAIMTEAVQKVQDLIRDRESYFASKGLYWVVPVGFPNWIELWKTGANQFQPNFVNNQGYYPQGQYAPLQNAGYGQDYYQAPNRNQGPNGYNAI